MINPSRLLWVVLWTVLMFPSFLAAQSAPLLSPSELDPYGFKRVWYHQLELHSAQGKIQGMLLEGGQLFLTTSDAKLHVLDSETGKWLWSRTIGEKSIPLTEPAVNSRVVAVHNNMTVYLFNRKTGKQLLQIPLPESAAAACEMSEHYLYVPMVNQTFLVYVLKEAPPPQPYEDPDTPALKPVGDDTDPELIKIVQQFEEAKRMLRAIEPEKEEPDTFVLDSTHRIPITGTSFGTVRIKPLFLQQFYSWVLDEAEQPTREINSTTHREFITWVTEQGFLFTAGINQLSDKNMTMLYRVDSAGQTFYMDWTRVVQIDRPGNKALVARPTHSQIYPVNEMNPDRIISPDVVVTGGRAQYVFAIDAQTGNIRWQYPTQGQLLEPIAVIGFDVYAPTANGGLHSLDLKTGKERWRAKNVKRFVAASQKRIYVLDQRERLACLDRATGALVFVYDIRRFDHCLFNLETDQIFLLTDKGLIQCLREKQFTEDTGGEVSLRHRISSAEFVSAAKGDEMPNLWWIDELETEKP
jgi:outer membrane protein assembly factor BamB